MSSTRSSRKPRGGNGGAGGGNGGGGGGGGKQGAPGAPGGGKQDGAGGGTTGSGLGGKGGGTTGGDGGAAGQPGQPGSSGGKKSTAPNQNNWRETDERFHKEVKAAKKSFYEGTPGLSPDTSKYIECPHCGRKFDPVVAEKHIPQCETHSFNKDEKDKFRKSKANLGK